MDVADKKFLIVICLLVAGVGVVVWVSGSGAAAMATKGGTSTSCTDSDGGNKPNVLGTVSGKDSNGAYAYTDSCIDGVTVDEFYCSSKVPGHTSRSCITRTTNACQNGACVYVAPPTASCADSDGGIVSQTFGVVSGTSSSGAVFSFNDTCINPSSVREFSCAGQTPVNTSISCLTNTTVGCEYGRCVNETTIVPGYTGCVDTDGGNAPLVAGTITYVSSGVTFTASDSCAGSRVNEAWCNGTAPKFTNTNCVDLGYNNCLAGQCARTDQDPCIDTDGGVNVLVAGSVTTTSISGVNTEPDKCYIDFFTLSNGTNNVSANILMAEQWCTVDMQRHISYVSCPTGYVCQDGACQTGLSCLPGVKCLTEGNMVGYIGYQAADCTWSNVTLCRGNCTNNQCNPLA